MKAGRPPRKIGSTYKDAAGYIREKQPYHPRSGKWGWVKQHTLVAERKIGRYLRPQEVVHHINYDKQDNRAHNIIVLPNESAHRRAHMLTDSLRACGNASFRKCQFCKKYDSHSNLNLKYGAYHDKCKRDRAISLYYERVSK